MDEMHFRVGKDDIAGYRNNYIWLKNHPAEVILFKQPAESSHKMKNSYCTSFSELDFGPLLKDADLIAVLKQIHKYKI